MTEAERKLAESWYQALRAWRVREVWDAVPSPRLGSGGAPARVIWGCPVCRYREVDRVDLDILEARSLGLDLRPVIREWAERMGVREQVVWTHAQHHLDPGPSRPLVGEWARCRHVRVGRHLLTPRGWIPVDRVLRAIREAPDEYRTHLDRARFGQGDRSLLTPDGRWANGRAPQVAEAMLWLVRHLAQGDKIC